MLPSEICDLIASAMERTRKQKFIVEGFPRNDAEMSIFESEIGQPHLWIQLDHAKVCVCVRAAAPQFLFFASASFVAVASSASRAFIS